MLASVRSELRKLLTTRLWWGMAIAMFLAAAVFSLGFAFLYTSSAVSDSGSGLSGVTATRVANGVYTAGLTLGYLLTLAIGVFQIGSEYRHKTISGTFLVVPRRARAMVAKVLALLVIGAGYGVVSLLGAVSVGASVLAARGADPFPSGAVFRTLLLSLLVLGLWALIGLGIGILIPNQVAALLIGVGVAWIVEPIAGFALRLWDVSRPIVPYFPTEATQAIVNGVSQSPIGDRLPWWGGALTLIAWAAVLAGFGVWRVLRQDIS